jgi:hypothetical protein
MYAVHQVWRPVLGRCVCSSALVLKCDTTDVTPTQKGQPLYLVDEENQFS